MFPTVSHTRWGVSCSRVGISCSLLYLEVLGALCEVFGKIPHHRVKYPAILGDISHTSYSQNSRHGTYTRPPTIRPVCAVSVYYKCILRKRCAYVLGCSDGFGRHLCFLDHLPKLHYILQVRDKPTQQKIPQWPLFTSSKRLRLRQ